MRVKMKNRKTGEVEIKDIAIELHHTSLPQRGGAKNRHEEWNLTEVDRWAHEGLDEYRHAGYDLVTIINGPNSWHEL